MQGLQSAVTAVRELRWFPPGRLVSTGLSRGFAPAGPPRSHPWLSDLARLAARPESQQRHHPGRWARARPSGSDSRAPSRARARCARQGRRGEEGVRARGAGPGRGLGAAPPAKLFAGAAPGRAVRAGASRLWPRPLSSPGAAVALGVLGGQRRPVVGGLWSRPARGQGGRKGGCLRPAPSRLQSRVAGSVLPRGGGRLGWQDSGAGAAGECGGAARQPGARAGGGASPALGQPFSGSRRPCQPRVNRAARVGADCTAPNLCGAKGGEFQGQR